MALMHCAMESFWCLHRQLRKEHKRTEIPQSTLYTLVLTFDTSVAGDLDNIDMFQLARDLASQSKESAALRGNPIPDEVNRCSSNLGGSGAERGTAAGPGPEPADSRKSAASDIVGPSDGAAATAGADNLSKEGMPSKAQVPQQKDTGKGAQLMLSQQMDQGRKGHPVPDMGIAAATASIFEAIAKTMAFESTSAQSTAPPLARQDRSAKHTESALQPNMDDIDQLAAGMGRRLAEDRAAKAAGNEAAHNQALEQSSTDVSVQEAKQARKQAKRARQRARRAQGAACGADTAGSKV